jgi:hypothetical protein
LGLSGEWVLSNDVVQSVLPTDEPYLLAPSQQRFRPCLLQYFVACCLIVSGLFALVLNSVTFLVELAKIFLGVSLYLLAFFADSDLVHYSTQYVAIKCWREVWISLAHY